MFNDRYGIKGLDMIGKMKDNYVIYYNQDMMHCKEHQCKKKEQCYRYWLGQNAKGLVSMYIPTIPVIEGCEHFIDIKGYDRGCKW